MILQRPLYNRKYVVQSHLGYLVVDWPQSPPVWRDNLDQAIIYDTRRAAQHAADRRAPASVRQIEVLAGTKVKIHGMTE